jgi:phosphopantothenate-cysteine ligase/phosphopantothenoylcysteine decarboxylase/phosphopantothenate--cysteine ligase
MHLLVTAGNTHTPIDQVRVITNIFTGRTGAAIAVMAHRRGHHVTLLTSCPEVLADWSPPTSEDPRWHLHTYRSFTDLENLLARLVPSGSFQAIIHAAAVSDYRVEGVYVPSASSPLGQKLTGGKIPSSYPELWVRLVPTPKLIDRFRPDWHFRGWLVKFKLEVGCSEEELLRRAETARRQSQADLLVANRLEDLPRWAWLGPVHGRYHRVERTELPLRLCQVLEELPASHPDSGWDSAEP